MPRFAIEKQFTLPVYQHDIIEASDLAEACRLAQDGDWDHQEQDFDNSGPIEITRVVELPEDYRIDPHYIGKPAAHALYAAALEPADIPAQFAAADRDRPTLDAIHNLMGGAERSGDTLEQIAELLREHGYTIRGPGKE